MRGKLLFCLLVLFLLVGVVNADTTTIYSNHAGRVTRGGVMEDFSTILAGAGTSVNTAATGNSAQLTANTTIDKYRTVNRLMFNFPLTAIPSGVIIDNVSLQLYGIDTGLTKTNVLGSPNFGITAAFPANPTAFVASDYSNVNSTRYASDVSYASMTATNNAAEPVIYFNSLGIAAVQGKSNGTSFNIACRLSWDIDADSSGITWSSGNSSYFQVDLPPYTGTSKDPALIVVWHVPDSDPPASITGLSSGYTCNSIIFTWNNPSDADYDHAYILKDGVFHSNVSTPTNTVTFSGLSSGSTTISVQTVDASGNMNATMVNKTVTIPSCTGFPGPMGTLANNVTNLSVSTYDGSGQETHPSVLYSSAGWNGYHYLMAMTPYPAGNNTFENPSMRYSNDMFTWVKLVGQPDTIISQPATGHYSDANIALNGSTLYLFYRWQDSDGAGHTIDYYNYTTTTDGVTWTSPIQTNLNFITSASFVYNGTGWEAYGNNYSSPYPIKHFTTTDLATWTESGTLSGMTMDTHTPYHSEIKIYDNQYQALVVASTFGRLYYFNSTDGMIWQPSESNPVLQGLAPPNWDEQLYKSSFIERSGVFDIWYTGWNTTGIDKWYIGYTRFPAYSAPVAAFTADKTDVCLGDSVQFTDESTNTPNSWNWSFGDGNLSYVQNPLFQYTQFGNYTVSLDAGNAYGNDTESKSEYIHVHNLTDPFCLPPPPPQVCENQTGNITINLEYSSQSSLRWSWGANETITSLSVDTIFRDFDAWVPNFTADNLQPGTYHRIKISNATDWGVLNCTTNASIPVYVGIPVMPSTEFSALPENLIGYWWIPALLLVIYFLFRRK